MMKRVVFIALIAFIITVQFAYADGTANALVNGFDTILDSSQTQSTTATGDDPGTTASEVLPGNGTRAGYMLGHGNVISGSEWVDIGPRHGTRNRDYTIDYASGTLFFTDPVSQMDSIRVDYRYSSKAQTSSSTGTPMVAMRFGSGVQTNMLYAYRPATASQGLAAQDVLTYGMNMLTKLGGASSLSSMFYVASPEAANRLSLDTTPQTAAQQNAPKLKKDRLMVQDADLSAGKVRLNINYQDVGKDFAGFQSLKDSNAATSDVLKQLEKEKGITRMGFSGNLPAGKDQGLSFGYNSIGDDTDDITSRSLDYKTGKFAFNYGYRDVGKNFARFSDIKEADRTQMAAEAGLSRTTYGMQLQTGFANKNALWSSVGFTDLNGDGGGLSYRTADVNLGTVSIQADVRTMDNTFTQMGALTDQERTRMALMARRQFDPSVATSQVTKDDKAQMNNEAGLDRQTCVVKMDVAKLDTWLSLSNIDSTKGGLTRRAFGVKGDRFSAYFDTQSVDKIFERLNALQPVERAHFGNETGMTRTELGGKLNILKSDVALNTANVVDDVGAGFCREALSVTNTKVTFKANLQDIDPRFSRIMDLSDSDREALLQDRGFKRSDYTIGLQATKALSINTYLYDSTNSTAGQTRGQTKYNIAYAPLSGPKISALTDDYSYISDDGNLSSYSHQVINYDHTLNMLGGLALKGKHDVYMTQDGENNPQTTTITENHISSNEKVKTSFTADIVSTDYGNGHFENTQGVGVKTATFKSLSLITGMSSTARDAGKSEDNGKLGFEWAMKKDLKMTFAMANRNGGPNGGQQSSSFSLNGPIAKRFLFLDNVVVASGTNQTSLRSKQTACNNALKIDAGMMGGKWTFDNSDKLNAKNGIYYTSRVLQYESNKDPKQPYHLTYFRQNLTTPLGTEAAKRNYALDVKLAQSSSLTLSSYEGKDGQNGVVIPVAGTVVKLSRPLCGKTTLTADYTTDDNQQSDRHANVVGLGIAGSVTKQSSYELYVGFCNLSQTNNSVRKGVCRAKWDTKMSSDRYLSLSYQRKSGVDQSSINPYEGDTVGSIDFKFLFD